MNKLSRPERLIVGAVVVLVLVVFVAIRVGYGAWAYGDWTCGFKHCVEVVR